jgi:catechol 2,3-dioxygenase-like lactoylglutathione lyase family enzyme
MILGFNHSGFVVRDIEKIVKFYRDDLGLTVMREVDSVAPPEGNHTGIPGAHRTLVFVGKPEGHHALELVHYVDPPSPEGEHLDRNVIGAAHICFNVTDLEQLYKDLTAKGIEFVTPPIINKDAKPGTTRAICYCKDPEGNFVELIEPAQ